MPEQNTAIYEDDENRETDRIYYTKAPDKNDHAADADDNKADEQATDTDDKEPRKKSRTDVKHLDSRGQMQQEDLQKWVDELPDEPMKIGTLNAFLAFIIPFLRILLPANIFRYFIGLIAKHTTLKQYEVAEAAGCSTDLVRAGMSEVNERRTPSLLWRRRKGGGRPRDEDYERLKPEIIKYVKLRSYGSCTEETDDYTAATLDSIRTFCNRKLRDSGCKKEISPAQVERMLHDMGITLKMNKKLLYGNQGTETEANRVLRHLQFDEIFKVIDLIGDPYSIVLSGDTKKIESLGFHALQNTTWSTKEGVYVPDHDFLKKLAMETLEDMDDLLKREEGKAIPQAIYDPEFNHAYVNIGVDHDTSEFACETIRLFWDRIKAKHPKAKKVYLLVDGGGAYSSRSILLKLYLLILSYQIKFPITVVHYPPYRSKFNLIERRVFAPLSVQYRRTILRNLLTIKTVTGNTRTKKGLKIDVLVDTNLYPLKQKVSVEQMAIISKHITYWGPTAETSVKLSYDVDGTNLTPEEVEAILPNTERKTVFDVKHDIELQKALKKAEKEAEKRSKSKAKNTKETSEKKPRRQKKTAI